MIFFVFCKVTQAMFVHWDKHMLHEVPLTSSEVDDELPPAYERRRSSLSQTRDDERKNSEEEEDDDDELVELRVCFN